MTKEAQPPQWLGFFHVARCVLEACTGALTITSPDFGPSDRVAPISAQPYCLPRPVDLAAASLRSGLQFAAAARALGGGCTADRTRSTGSLAPLQSPRQWCPFRDRNWGVPGRRDLANPKSNPDTGIALFGVNSKLLINH